MGHIIWTLSWALLLFLSALVFIKLCLCFVDSKDSP